MRAHVIENGKVVNTIEVDSLDFMPGLIRAEVGGIEWLLVEGELLPPPPKPRAREQIMADLELIDLKTIRPLREGDQERIAEFDAMALLLREELWALDN